MDQHQLLLTNLCILIPESAPVIFKYNIIYNEKTAWQHDSEGHW